METTTDRIKGIRFDKRAESSKSSPSHCNVDKMHRHISFFAQTILSLYVILINNPYSESIKTHSTPIINSNRENKVQQNEIDLGTTILAIKHKGGTIVACDTRTSLGGSYVSNRFANKLSFVLDNESKTTCCICRSGSAADTQYIIDTAREVLLQRSLSNTSAMFSIKNVAHVLRYILTRLKKRRGNVSSTFICTGYDALTDESILYTINSCGTLLQHHDNWVAFGSGSSFIIGYLEELCGDNIDDMDEGQIINIVKRALEIAIDQDGKSGSGWIIYALDRFGKRRVML